MAHDAARLLIDQALEEVRRGNYAQSVDLLERAIRLEPSSSEAHLLLGVSRSALGQSESASRAFQQAIELSPENARAFYNFAVHLYGVGDKATALEMAREAVRVDPAHGQARDLATRIEGETGVEHLELPKPTPKEPTEAELAREMATEQGYERGASTPYLRPPAYAGEYETPVHSIAFVEQMGVAWDLVGWALCLIGIICFVGYIIAVLHTFTSVQNAFENQFKGGIAIPQWIVVLRVVALCDVLALIIWMCVDISDRRSNWFWILPNLVLCCFYLNWVIVVIYILAGRPVRWSGPRAA